MSDRNYIIARTHVFPHNTHEAAIAGILELIETETGTKPSYPALGFYKVRPDGVAYQLDLAENKVGHFHVNEIVTFKYPTREEASAHRNKLLQQYADVVQGVTHDGVTRYTFATPHMGCIVEETPPPLTTFALIKPGTLRHRHEILYELEEHKFAVVRERIITGDTSTLWAEFYKEHKGKPFYDGLIEHMTSGPSLALELTVSGDPDANVVQKWRDLIGATDCSSGLRKKYGTTPPDNAFHGSDSRAAVAREMAQMFL